MTDLVCDFCSVREPVWRYPARSFDAIRVPGLIGSSTGDWAACETCAAFIEANDNEGLAVEAVRTFAQRFEIPFTDRTMQMIRELHDRFRAARSGDRVREGGS